MFKKIILSPFYSLNPNTDINVVETNNYDFTHLDSKQSNAFFKQLNKWLKSNKDKGVIVLREQDSKPYISIQINAAANKKNVLSFPEPNPVRIYYNSANIFLQNALDVKNKLLQIHTAQDNNQYELFSKYFENASLGVIMLIASVEAFMNQMIPKNINIEIDGKNCDKEDIEYMDFNSKITKFLSALTGKDLFVDMRPVYDTLSVCNSLRDDVIHIKREINENGTAYEKIYKRLFDMPLLESSNCVFNFINYFHPNYLKENGND